VMKWCAGLFMSGLAVLAGCGKSPAPNGGATGTNRVERSFETRGVVRVLPEGGHTVVVRHEEIRGYMPRMTMELNVRDTNELAGLQRDDEITFRLVATAETHWIENIRRVGRATTTDASLPVSATNKVSELRPGDLLPDVELLTEDGSRVRFSDFRGRAVAFTFIFTRCPLPDYCPRMGNNFARTRELMFARANAPTNWQFLSISFDPEFDTPAQLKSYGNAYRGGNADRWRFAVASTEVLAELSPRLDLMITREAGGSISHNLRTVVLDPQGRITWQFDGNRWTPEELAKALSTAAKN
jgi:protein SCO1/2